MKSKNLAILLEQQELITKWLEECEKKLYILEESYLQEFPNNIVKGWQDLMEGKPIPQPDKKRQIDDNERIFSSQSFLASAARIEAAGDDGNKHNTEDGRKRKRKRDKEKDVGGQKDRQDAKWRKELEVDHVSYCLSFFLYFVCTHFLL